MNKGSTGLSNVEFDQLHEALLSAFPNQKRLAWLVKISLNENLEAVAGTGDLHGIIFELIRWAEAYGRLVDLVSEASRRNPGNPHLKEFVDQHPHLIAKASIKDADLPAEDLFSAETIPNSVTSQENNSESHIAVSASAGTLSSDLEVPTGTIPIASHLYIERKTDKYALGEILYQGRTVVIKGSRQMGKSSLLLRIKNAAEGASKHVASVDLQLFNQTSLSDARTFYRQFCYVVTRAVGLADQSKTYLVREDDIPTIDIACTEYFEEYILAELEKQRKSVVLTLDESDKILNSQFSSDFFGMLRSWHEARRSKPRWKLLDLVLVISTEPYQLIDKQKQSPFNVGLVLDLEDFDPSQQEILIERYKTSPMNERSEELWELLEGHPYLTQRALFVVSKEYVTVDRLFTESTRSNGPFRDHLQYHLSHLQRQPNLKAGLLQVIEHNRCQDIETLYHLRSAGLIRETDDNKVKPRCKLYANYFWNHLHG